ncbi:DUF4160 domain-containing protein [Spirosoma rhododendri]|uniref:DUF4160 domain-containing protein n=1 Tax=Spirosoma rhododendri TaxID=2728024 RepID=A0A7L5DHU9_9BACT|nr:DUF4160 domain-containing protein [Spirosoma rhododendri]QJD77889.1 DUF4160 domain-containing protein [Spirosoma rhododendri]
MPTVLLIRGYRFYFYLNEHEPIHIHVSKGGSEARFVLVPEIDMTYSRGFKKSEIRDIVTIISDHYETIINA